MWCVHWIVLFSAVIFGIRASFYDIFRPCCLEGAQWSSTSGRCDNYPAPVVNISDNDQAACLAIIEVCCMKQTHLQTCEDGKQTALENQICAIRDSDPGAEQFRECCNCCQLGLVARTATPSCVSPGFGEPCDTKYSECCKGDLGGDNSSTPANLFDPFTTNIYSYVEETTPFPTSPNSNVLEQDLSTSAEVIGDKRFAIASDYGPSNQSDEDRGSNNQSDEDVDECALFPQQVCSHICVNTKIGFYCSCPDHLKLDPSNNRTCIPTVVEEKPVSVTSQPKGPNGQHDCEYNNPCEQRCLINEENLLQCKCYDGYRLAADKMACEDIDECKEKLVTCPSAQMCVNTRGGHTCVTRCPPNLVQNPLTGVCEQGKQQCKTGFVFNAETNKCEDLNECGLGIDSCDTGARCENTIGSYVCRRERHCGTGYTLDEETQKCLDNDECALGTHNCNEGYKCQNIQGSFRCLPKSCPKGFRFDPVKAECIEVLCPVGLRANKAGNCVDINECTEMGNNTCRRHQRCVNTRGSYHCRNIINCPPGYEPSEANGCIDINECEKGTHNCGTDQQCINKQGTYLCQCPRGMKHDSLGGCVDVDECSYGAAICPVNSQCVNTVGSFKCECSDGLVADGNDACTDVDECLTDGICQQNCVNVLGSYFCSCNRGYQLRDDKISCEDIDECTQFGFRGANGALCSGRCVNVPGSYKCECPEGWRLKPDGRTCEDVNECSELTAYCPHPESMCFNIRGGYKCPIVRCPEGFIKTNASGQQNSLRCKRISTDCFECRRGLISRTYNFLSFASNVIVPAPLFSMTGSRLIDKFYTWDLELLSTRPLKSGILSAQVSDFSLEKSRDFSRVTLIKRIDGPQDIVLKLSMNVTSYYKGFEGTAESRIYLYITEDELVN